MKLNGAIVGYCAAICILNLALTLCDGVKELDDLFARFILTTIAVSLLFCAALYYPSWDGKWFGWIFFLGQWPVSFLHVAVIDTYEINSNWFYVITFAGPVALSLAQAKIWLEIFNNKQ